MNTHESVVSVGRSNRRLRLAAMAALTACCALGLLLGTNDGDKGTIKAQRFILEGPDGKVRAELSFKDSAPGLFFYDLKGQRRISIWLRDKMDGEAGITIIGRQGALANLYVDDDGPMLQVMHDGKIGAFAP